MFDQTFSAENLKSISDYEHRRGSNHDQLFFPTVKEKTDKLREKSEATKSFRKLHKGPYSASDQAIFDSLKEERENSRKAKDEELDKCLSKVSEKISKKSFNVEFTPKSGPSGKPVYVAEDNPETYYAIKQLSRNLSRLYKVKQANRNLIISQLFSFLSDGFPYYLIKLDISKFFESIDQKTLLKKLVNDQLLSKTSLRLISGILWKYSDSSGTKGVGIPRGIGLSSYLSELYMKDFDALISRSSDVAFYARYVDDIVILFAPSKMSNFNEYLDLIKNAVSEKKLTINQKKLDYFEIAKNKWNFEYLGYEFIKPNGEKPNICLSGTKYQRYENRLTACFKKYEMQKAKNYKRAYRLLIKRIQYLTSNTQLSHNKQNAYVGIYFGSPHLTEFKQLKQLDDILKKNISLLTSKSLKTRLFVYSFQEGYHEKIYRRFHRKNEFTNIVRAWAYEK